MRVSGNICPPSPSTMRRASLIDAAADCANHAGITRSSLAAITSVELEMSGYKGARRIAEWLPGAPANLPHPFYPGGVDAAAANRDACSRR